MKTATGLMQSLLQADETTFAFLWLITRVDGTVFAFTTFDRNITYQGVTYEAATGITQTAHSTRADLGVGNMEVTSFLESDSIDEGDLRAGLFDNAAVELFVVNWPDFV